METRTEAREVLEVEPHARRCAHAAVTHHTRFPLELLFVAHCECRCRTRGCFPNALIASRIRACRRALERGEAAQEAVRGIPGMEGEFRAHGAT